MEVASPLPFSHASAGSKRQFPGSPGLVDSTNRNPFSHPNHNESNSMMESSSEEYVHARMKRRRFEDSMDDSNNNISLDSHNFASFPPTKNYFNGHATQFLQSNNHSAKRSRTDAHSPQQEHGGPPSHELQQEVERQASEIATLKNEKTNMEHSYGQLKTEHEKVVQENKILKKAVTIQQERQSQTANELESARQYKVGAEEQIRKLEQIILSLRYHLQTQQSNPSFGNDFMGQFRPPDVY